MTEDVELELTADAEPASEPVWLEELRGDLERASAREGDARPAPTRGRLLGRLLGGRS